MDFSMWIQSPTDLGMLFLSAMLIGMSKTGIQGISLLAVPLMAMTFGAKPSTGLILPILCVADLVATRKEGRAEFRLDREKGVKAHLYCFFASPDGATFSNSQYICL